MTQFETGQTYEMTFIGNSDLKVKFNCIKRTNKTATFKKVNGKEQMTRKIKVSQDVEYVLSDSYSFAPIINSRRKV